MNIAFQKCTESRDKIECADELDFNQWLKDKYLLLYYNEIRFKGENRTDSEARVV